MPLLVTETVTQQVPGTSTNDYGFSTTNLTTTAGSLLVVLAGWDLSVTGSAAFMPAVYVTDSAGNVWDHVATSSSSVSGSRSAAWVCVNSRPVTWISVSLTTFASSLAYNIIEVVNGPANFSIDVVATNSNDLATSLAVSPGNTESNGIAFSVFSAGAVTAPSWPPGWAGLSPVISGGSEPNPVHIFPFWRNVAAGQSLNTTYNVPIAVPVSGITFSLEQNPPSPVPPSPAFPLVSIEAAFGFLPGDPSQSPPVWTDISNRVIGAQGSTSISTNAGRQYELSTPEAGELTINLDNHDGAFTPGNADSPFYPNVVLQTPVRVRAFYQGAWYSIAYGYIERWPQEWPDLPQWGISNLVAVDTVAVLSNITMPSALDGDVLMDNPYIMIPANEQYSVFTNGFNSFISSAESQGLLAANTSRNNQRAAMYVDGTAAAAAVGQSTNLLGDSDSGFGTGSIGTIAFTAPASGPGIIYTDPNLPDVVDPGAVTVEFWVIIPVTVPDVSLQPTVFQAFGFPSNYTGNNPSLSVQINNITGGNTLTVTLADGSAVTAAFNVNPAPQLITLVMTQASLNVYVNGALEAAAVLNAGQTTHWSAIALGCCNYAFESGAVSTGNFTAFDLAVYPYLLSTQRIVSHFSTGSSGQENSDATARIAQILDWGNIGIARGGQVTFSGVHDGVLQGPAYQLVGTNAMDGINQVAGNHNAMVAAMADGALVYTHKWGLIDKSPVAIFGDSVNPLDGQIPSAQGTGFGYDNTFLINNAQVTQQNGPTTSITVTSNDFTSQHEYFARSGPAKTISTMNNLDVYDAVNWEIARYSQPAFRLTQVTLDASANPSIFPVILSLQQGDVVGVIRQPMGGATINILAMIQKVSHSIGPRTWQTTYQLSPYTFESSILELSTPGFNILGSNTLG